MAIDSKDKRFSMLNFGDGALLPDPDGEIVFEDRLHFLGLFGAGVAAPAPAVSAPVGAGKKDRQPSRKPISPLEYVPGWQEKIRAAEKDMWAQQRDKLDFNRPESQKIEIQPGERRIKRPQKRVVRRTNEKLDALRGNRQNPLDAVNVAQKRRAIESRVEKSMVAAEKQERVDAQLAKEADFKRRKTALVNMEFMKEAQAKKQAVEAIRKKEMQKRMKKVRAAKKRKKK